MRPVKTQGLPGSKTDWCELASCHTEVQKEGVGRNERRAGSHEDTAKIQSLQDASPCTVWYEDEIPMLKCPISTVISSFNLTPQRLRIPACFVLLIRMCGFFVSSTQTQLVPFHTNCLRVQS